MDDSSEFSKSFFSLLGWLLMAVPVIYGLVAHEWGLLIGVSCGAVGGIMKNTITHMDQEGR